MNKINGKSKNTYINCIKTPENIIVNGAKEMANILAAGYAKNSSKNNYDPTFLLKKMEVVSFYDDPEEAPKFPELNKRFYISELTLALKTCGNTSPGSDKIPNILIKNVSKQAIKYLIDIYNHSWKKSVS